MFGRLPPAVCPRDQTKSGPMCDRTALVIQKPPFGLFGVGKALVDKERIAIGALDFAALVRKRKIDTGMAKSTLTTVASDAPLINNLGLGCRNAHCFAFICCRGSLPALNRMA